MTSLFSQTKGTPVKYTPGHFRNRIYKIQQELISRKVTSLLIIAGVDSNSDGRMHQLINWLILGYKSQNITTSVPDEYLDFIMLIAIDAIYIYSDYRSVQYLTQLTCLCANVQIYALNESEFLDEDNAEIHKVGEFYSMVFDKKSIGIVLQPPEPKDDYAQLWGKPQYLIKVLEKWPIFQAYALDLIGDGFFTMKHQVVIMNSFISDLFTEYDNYMVYSLIKETIPRMEEYYMDSLINFNAATINKKLQTTQLEVQLKQLSSGLLFPYEHGLLTEEVLDIQEHRREDNLPLPRILFGDRTNDSPHDYAGLHDKTRLEKGNSDKSCPVHFTMEYVDYATSIRYARTYFLTNCNWNYMEGFQYEHMTSPLDISHSQIYLDNARILFGIHHALWICYSRTLQMFTDGKVEKSIVECERAIYQFILEHMRKHSPNLPYSISQGDVKVNINQYNARGGLVSQLESSSGLCRDCSLYIYRVSIGNIRNGQKDNLGTIILGDSFQLLESLYVMLTKSIPIIQSYFTSPLHYPKLDFNPQKVANLNITNLREKTATYAQVYGWLPFNLGFTFTQHELFLFGTLTIYEGGLGFYDLKLGMILLDFPAIKVIKIYLVGDAYLQITLAKTNILPLTMLNTSILYFLLPSKFMSQNYFQFQELLEENNIPLEKISEGIPGEIKNSEMMRKYTEQAAAGEKSCPLSELTALSLKDKTLDSMLQFREFQEFALLRSKRFISYKIFLETYRYKGSEHRMDITDGNKSGKSGKCGVLFITGAPGVHKMTFASSFMRFVDYSGKKNWIIMRAGLEEIGEVLERHRENDGYKHPNVILVISGFHSMKGVLTSLNKLEWFSSNWIVQGVISKVRFESVYGSRHQGIYPFMLENSARGVANVIVLERGGGEPEEVAKWIDILSYVNERENIVSVRMPRCDQSAGRAIVSLLEGVNTRLHKLHGVYGYSWEREGRPMFYSHLLHTQCTQLEYHVPLMGSKLEKYGNIILGEGYGDQGFEFLRYYQEEEKERREMEKREDLVKGLDQKILISDLRGEHEMILGINKVKNRTKRLMQVQRFQGVYVDELTQRVMEVEATPTQCVLKETKSKSTHLYFQLIGSNLDVKLFKTFLHMCRSQFPKMQSFRDISSITQEEKAQLEDIFRGDMMPNGILYDGFSYLDYEGNRYFEHPKIDLLIENYIKQENSKIEERNNNIRSKMKAFEEKYKTDFE